MGIGAIGGHLPAHGLLALGCAIACGLGAGACGKSEAFHETQEVRSQACVTCHKAAYDATQNPKHAGAFPESCKECHSTKSWVPASSMSHDWFPLREKHAAVGCASCHQKGFGPGDTPKECVGCHLDDYEASPFPGHQTFPQTCADCHATSGWKPALGANHPNTAFPLTGPHSMPCLDCHNPNLGAPTGGQNTDCVGCHSGEHSRAKMDAKHREERDYPLGAAPPNFCLDCHANGRH